MRSPVRVLLSVLLLAALAPSAAAHPQLDDAELPLESPTDLPITILADEQAPLVEIELEAPVDYTVLDVVSAPGWQVTHTEKHVRLTGSTIPVGGRSVVTIRGIAHRSGQLVLTMVTRAQDGQVRRWDGASRLSAFPGVIVTVSPRRGPREPTPWGSWAAGGVVFALVAGGGVFALRRARRPISPGVTNAGDAPTPEENP